jgi:hypothetical protein
MYACIDIMISMSTSYALLIAKHIFTRAHDIYIHRGRCGARKSCPHVAIAIDHDDHDHDQMHAYARAHVGGLQSLSAAYVWNMQKMSSIHKFEGT